MRAAPKATTMTAPEDQREEESHRKREVALEHQERDLDALLVLQDEDEDHDQRDQADDDGRPCAAQAGLPLAEGGGSSVSRARRLKGCRSSIRFPQARYIRCRP